MTHSFTWPTSQSESQLCETLELIVAGKPPIRPASFWQCPGF
jgi:hypothetical protein